MRLSRYTQSLRCIHDNGDEFRAQEFTDTLRYYGIQNGSTAVKNPQANLIVERMHHTTGNIFRSMAIETQNNNHCILPADLNDFIDTAPLASTQSAITASIQESPEAFVYQRNVMIPIQ